jgi:poly-beta-1,6-N-acetyl-D-glucosamine synthase
MTFLFWAAALLVSYTYLGYLSWLWLWARLAPWPVLRGQVEPYVSIVMIVRNGEPWLEDKLQNLLSLDYPPDRLQIVVVSDGSTDHTESILRRYASDSRVQALMNQLPRGKASGLNNALGVTTGEIVVLTDVRQKIEPGAIRLIAGNFVDPEIGCVSGALMLGDPDSGEAGKGMGLYWRFEKKIRELESASGSVVGATGALYAVRRESLKEIPEGTILDDVYIPLQVAREGKRIIFDERARAWDVPDLGGELEFARKVRTLSGNYQLLQLAPWILSGQNPLLGRFISHKLLRLVVPFALAAILVSSALITTPFYRVALILQLGFYVLAAAALLRLPRPGVIARLADAAGTFVLLNTAAVVAFANFIAGRRAAWSR